MAISKRTSSKACGYILHAEPPVGVEARRDIAILVSRQELLALFGHLEFSVRVFAAERSCNCLAAAVDLRPIPPGGIDVFVPWALKVGCVMDVVGLSSG